MYIYYLQVGGLGDVVTSLSRAVQELNHNVDIIFPKYDCLKHNFVRSMSSLVFHFHFLCFLHICLCTKKNLWKKKSGEGLEIRQKLSLGRNRNKNLAWKGGRPFGLLLRSAKRVSFMHFSLSFLHNLFVISMKKLLFVVVLDLCRLFQRGCVYGCADDAGRFGFFCHAALEFLLQGGFHPVRLLIIVLL